MLSVFPQQQRSISTFETQGSIIVPAPFTMHSVLFGLFTGTQH